MNQPLRAAATLPGARLTALVRLAPLAVAQEFFHQRFRARWERRKHASDDETQAAKGAAQIVAQIPVALLANPVAVRDCTARTSPRMAFWDGEPTVGAHGQIHREVPY